MRTSTNGNAWTIDKSINALSAIKQIVDNLPVYLALGETAEQKFAVVNGAIEQIRDIVSEEDGNDEQSSANGQTH